ncbi:hypothetical protein, partial [Mesorhizobium sp. B261B1A]|uniref:hypothetical protein n=1 Tax=Mesorhizobium sp. B261B1A TaxID=2876671 RepID=UPI001CD04493
NTSGQKPKVLPMCPVQNVTYVSGRSKAIRVFVVPAAAARCLIVACSNSSLYAIPDGKTAAHFSWSWFS